MFSLFRRASQPGPETCLPSALQARRMNLEERKSFRRDLADQVIHDCLLSLGVAAGQYRLRIMPLDTRHHRFIAMLDLSPGFEPRRGGLDWEHAAVEAEIRRSAYERFGLVIDGVYWRRPAERQGIEHRGAGRSSASDQPTTLVFDPRPSQLVSEEEKQALMEAIRLGGELPVLHVGELEYLTEITPLEEPGRPYPGRPVAHQSRAMAGRVR